mgnify:CR=1 FL=1
MEKTDRKPTPYSDAYRKRMQEKFNSIEKPKSNSLKGIKQEQPKHI